MKMLFICTHNRCRSILCEALTNALSDGALVAFSAGSQPAGAVHPETLRHLRRRGVDIAGLRSKSWEEFTASAPDLVITVCDSAAGEACPLWLSGAQRVHWGLPDPSRVDGSQEAIDAAFDAVINTIESGIRRLLQIAPMQLNPASAAAALQSATE